MTKQKNFPLAKLTTFRVGGPAEYFAAVKTEDELTKLLLWAKAKRLSLFVLGGGSNVLVSDKPFRGLVLHLVNKNIKEENGLVTAGAGLEWDDLVEFSVNKGLQGIECLSGIPGTVGAAPVQNIGAYGQELKDTFIRLRAYDLKKNKFLIIKKKDCNFSYRDSLFKKNKGQYIVYSITLKLKKAPPQINYQSLKDYFAQKAVQNPKLQEVRNAVLAIRSQKLEDPKINGNAGSFFKNPIISKTAFQKIGEKYPEIPNFPAEDQKRKIFAGWLIEKSGWKGKKYKSVGVSEKNALVLINPHGQGKAKDIRELAEKIIADVDQKFGIKLVPEVQFVNF